MRSHAALIAQITSDRLQRIQQQTHSLKRQLLEFIQEDESQLESEHVVADDLQQQLSLCQQERDNALAECECACEAAAKANSEYVITSELLLTHKLQVTSLMDELECRRQQLVQLSSSHDALKRQFDKASAALVSHQQVAACNNELQHMVASAEAVSADTSSALETTQRQLQAAMDEAEFAVAAKNASDHTCEAALRQLEQSAKIQSKLKERILELTKSLSELKLELQSIRNEQGHSSQDATDLRRSLSAAVLEVGQLTAALDSTQFKAMQQDAALLAANRELALKEDSILVILNSLETAGKERQRLQLQALFLD
jgi:chromosome segregation ATPase